jgi:FdrA protein
MVGIISTDSAGLHEISCLLALEGASTSRAIQVNEPVPEPGDGQSTMLAALRALQDDPGTEVIILVRKAPPAALAKELLAQIQNHDKPAVVCFLRGDPRHAWRAGAIPATRLDEAAARAAAWVRGWDQALISSRLEEQVEHLATWAHELRPRVGQGRHALLGLFASDLLCHEAQLVLGSTLGEARQARAPHRMQALPKHETRLRRLQETLADPTVAVLLLDLAQGQDMHPESVDALAEALEQSPCGLLIVAHLCEAGDNPQRLARLVSALHSAGALMTCSNAEAAQLAGLLLAELATI